MNVLSGMVRSLRKVRLLEHSAGSVVGIIVGRGDDSTITIGCVGLIIKVGSISGACDVGGRKGVAVGAGEQAEAMERIRKMANKHLLKGGNRWLGMTRSISLKLK